MTEAVTSRIVKQEEHSRIVELSARYHPEWRDSIELLFAECHPQFMDFIRMNNAAEPQKFHLTAEEADAFTLHWMAYRETLREKEEAEKQRLQEIIDEAYKIAEQCPAIKIEETLGYYDEGKPAWMVSIPGTGFAHYRPIGEPKAFLEMVRDAQNAWENHQKFVAARSTSNL